MTLSNGEELTFNVVKVQNKRVIGVIPNSKRRVPSRYYTELILAPVEEVQTVEEVEIESEQGMIDEDLLPPSPLMEKLFENEMTAPTLPPPLPAPPKTNIVVKRPAKKVIKRNGRK